MGSDIEHQRTHDEVQVIAEFGDVSDGTSYVEHGMAREIMRLRSILDALREPSEAALQAAEACFYAENKRIADLEKPLQAAFAAAEKEVQREAQ